MDINNYSYAPYMLDNSYIEEYSNDDMEANISENYGSGYDVFAFSYDGSLDISEHFRSLHYARVLYSEIVERYSDTPPGDELETLIASVHNQEEAA